MLRSWPDLSESVNPIENLWTIVEMNKTTKTQLLVFQNLITSITERISAVKKNQMGW